MWVLFQAILPVVFIPMKPIGNENGPESQTFGITSPSCELNNQHGVIKTAWTYVLALLPCFWVNTRLSVNSHHSLSWCDTPTLTYVHTIHTHTHTHTCMHTVMYKLSFIWSWFNGEHRSVMLSSSAHQYHLRSFCKYGCPALPQTNQMNMSAGMVKACVFFNSITNHRSGI